MNKVYILGLMLTLVGLASCGNSEKEYDATGTFEATEITVSAEQNGTLLNFTINEGDNVEAGKQVGLVDTVQLYLKARQIGATKMVYASQRPDMVKQVATTRQQLAKAREEYDRFAALVKEVQPTARLLTTHEVRCKCWSDSWRHNCLRSTRPLIV